MKNKQKWIAMVSFVFLSHAVSWGMSALGYGPKSLIWWIAEIVVWTSYVLGCISGGIEIERHEENEIKGKEGKA